VNRRRVLRFAGYSAACAVVALPVLIVSRVAADMVVRAIDNAAKMRTDRVHARAYTEGLRHTARMMRGEES